MASLLLWDLGVTSGCQVLRGKQFYLMSHLASPVVNKILLKNKNDFHVVLIIFYLFCFTTESYAVVQAALELTVCISLWSAVFFFFF